MKQKRTTILSIETSCDDTCVAIIEAKGQKSPRFEILSNIISSQVKIHRKWGGVYPTLAKREHQRNLVPILRQSLSEARLLKSNLKSQISKIKIGDKNLEEILKKESDLLKRTVNFLKQYKKPKIDVLAVTIGPGLEPCLWVGVNFAKALSYSWDLPILPINHIEAHILANWLPPVGSSSKFQIPNSKNFFPAICSIISGGHTQLILMRNFGKYKILGETRDDAAGECFDKVARILGLDYPGGPAIEAETAKKYRGPTPANLGRIKLPRPMIHQKNYDFSFSGLKTAVLYNFKSQPEKIRKSILQQRSGLTLRTFDRAQSRAKIEVSKKYIQAVATEVQQAIIDVLIHKTLKAAKEYRAKSIILGGGVTANNELRKQFKSKVYSLKSKVNFLVPPKNLCTDNAAMVAVTAYYHWLKGKTKNWKNVKANANLKIG